MARGIAEITLGRPFYVLLSNLSDCTTQIPRKEDNRDHNKRDRSHIGRHCIIERLGERDEEYGKRHLLYRKDENRDEQMDRHLDVKGKGGETARPIDKKK